MASAKDLYINRMAARKKPKFDSENLPVRAEYADPSMNKPNLIPHLEAPQSIKNRLRREANPTPRLI